MSAIGHHTRALRHLCMIDGCLSTEATKNVQNVLYKKPSESLTMMSRRQEGH
jgi:hypothetical protein